MGDLGETNNFHFTNICMERKSTSRKDKIPLEGATEILGCKSWWKFNLLHKNYDFATR